MSEQQLRERRNELLTEIKELRDAMDILDGVIKENGGSNRYISELKRELVTKYEAVKNQLSYIDGQLSGPWMTDEGRIKRGQYKGIDVVPLLRSLAESCKDFPTAMRMIAEAASDREMLEIDFTFYPEDYANGHPSKFGYLMGMAPDANWDNADEIGWST